MFCRHWFVCLSVRRITEVMDKFFSSGAMRDTTNNPKGFWGLRPDVSAPKAIMKASSVRTKVLQLSINKISLTFRGSTLDVMMLKIKYVCGLWEICC